MKIGREELAAITAEDWAGAIDLASQQEAFYAEQDQLDPPLVPEVQDEPVQGELIPNEIVVVPETAQKCSNCDYETVQAHAAVSKINENMKSIIMVFNQEKET